MNIKKALNSKKFKYGGMSILFALIFIAVVVVLNLMVEMMTERFNLKQDITAEGLYSVSDTTIEMLENLEEDITVYIMLPEADVMANSGYNLANELLKKMVGYSGGKLSLEYVDLLVNPNIRNNFTDSDSIVTGSIVMKSSKREQIISINDLYDTSYDFQSQQEYISGYQADRKFASAVHYVTTEELPTVAYVTGHGEVVDNESLNNVFTSNSYNIIEIALLNEDIPEEVDILVINAPTNDFSEDEIVKLNDYLTRPSNNDLIMVHNIQAGELERLHRYLTEWGIGIQEGIVVDTERAAGANPAMFIAEMTDHEINEQITVEAVVIPGTANLEVLWESDGYRTVYPLAQSSSSAYLETEDGTLEGPFTVAAVTQDYQMIQNVSVVHNVLFLGSWEMLSGSVLDNSAFQNNKFLTSALNFINPSVDAVLVEAVDFGNPQMIITGNTSVVLLVVLVILVPLAFFAIGIFVFIRRKNR